MSTSSNKPFGNDTARDWAWNLTGESGRQAITSTLNKALACKGPLEASDAEEVVAAAAVVAGAAHDPVTGLSSEIKSWTKEFAYVPS